MIDHASISIKQHVLAEVFRIKISSTSIISVTGIWNDEDSPNGFSGFVVSNDSPSVDVVTADIVNVKKKMEVTRLKDNKKYYVIDISPDDGGQKTIKISRTCPQ